MVLKRVLLRALQNFFWMMSPMSACSAMTLAFKVVFGEVSEWSFSRSENEFEERSDENSDVR